MSKPPTDFKKLFTVEEANAMLPLVRAIAKDLSSLSRTVIERRERLAHLLDGREADEDDPYAEELAQMGKELEKDNLRLQGYVDELLVLGVEPKNGPEGLIDFPSEMDGRAVYLCWRLDEPEVLFWHELEAGYAGRQSLTAGSVAEEGGDATGDGYPL